MRRGAPLQLNSIGDVSITVNELALDSRNVMSIMTILYFIKGRSSVYVVLYMMAFSNGVGLVIAAVCHRRFSTILMTICRLDC